jgi:nitrate reductase NapE component
MITSVAEYEVGVCHYHCSVWCYQLLCMSLPTALYGATNCSVCHYHYSVWCYQLLCMVLPTALYGATNCSVWCYQLLCMSLPLLCMVLPTALYGATTTLYGATNCSVWCYQLLFNTILALGTNLIKSPAPAQVPCFGFSCLCVWFLNEFGWHTDVLPMFDADGPSQGNEAGSR